jgi:hypothetical protein
MVTDLDASAPAKLYRVSSVLNGPQVLPTYNFNSCDMPLGSFLTGAARLGDDGTGSNCVLHLTDASQCPAHGALLIVSPARGKNVDQLHAHWRSRIGGNLGTVCTGTQFGVPGGNGYSFSWGTDVEPDASGEEGTGTGLIVSVDTWDDSGGEAPGLEVKWRGNRIALHRIDPSPSAAKIYLRKNQFVEADLLVEPNGHLTFTYDGKVIDEMLPDWTGITGGAFVFGARTGAASDNHWLDDISIVAIDPSPGICAPIPTGAIGWWPGDGYANDLVGGRAGQPANGLSFVPGKVGPAFQFDGDDRLLIGAGPVSPPWTAEFWVNRQDSLDDSAILLGDAATALKLEQWPNTRQIGFTRFGVADYAFDCTAPIGTWVHIAFVADASKTQLYLNGNLEGAIPATIPLPLGQMGGDIPGRFVNRMNALVDELTIYNRALERHEIQAIYDARANGKCK